jgi:hypothetical protein
LSITPAELSAPTWLRRAPLHRMARETSAAYRSGEAPAARDVDRVVPRLAAAVDALVSVPVDDLDESQVRDELRAIEDSRRRLDARACRLAAALTQRQQTRAKEAQPDNPRAAAKAERQTRRELQDELRWTPSQAKRAQQLGRGLFQSPRAGAAFDAGSLPPAHAKLLADTLHWLEGDRHDEVESKLLAAARHQDAHAFGRTCRRLLAEVDHDSAMRAEQRRRHRRRGSLVQTEDGMTRLVVDTSGIDGEYLATSIHAFRRLDAEGETRTPEQRTADAVVAMAKAALEAGTAPRQHGERPQLLVLADRDTVMGTRGGSVETMFSGPLPAGEGLRILDDCKVSQLLCDTRGIPVEASEGVRSVPAGVKRGVIARDGGRCIGDGCDVPAGWCEMMHLDVPYRLQGRLTIDTAAFGCDFHHHKFDHAGWRIAWLEGRPILHHPARPPNAPGSSPPDRPPNASGASPPRDRPPPDQPLLLGRSGDPPDT